MRVQGAPAAGMKPRDYVEIRLIHFSRAIRASQTGRADSWAGRAVLHVLCGIGRAQEVLSAMKRARVRSGSAREPKRARERTASSTSEAA